MCALASKTCLLHDRSSANGFESVGFYIREECSTHALAVGCLTSLGESLRFRTAGRG